jgi:ParB family chromosome partitioning protein
VPLTQVVPSPLQPRTTFIPEHLAELVDSIRENGIIQPLIVRRVNELLELIAGERRWRAAGQAGLREVPVIVREATDLEVLEFALVENLQREDLNPIEEALAYKRLADEFKLRQEEIAKKVGKSRAAVANTMRLLELDGELQTHLVQGRLTVGHAKALLGLRGAEDELPGVEADSGEDTLDLTGDYADYEDDYAPTAPPPRRGAPAPRPAEPRRRPPGPPRRPGRPPPAPHPAAPRASPPTRPPTRDAAPAPAPARP